jgi:two-component system LytT family response regulator
MTSNVSVMIVDDEPLARRTLRDHLGTVDWIGEIREAGDGLTAIREIDSFKPDLVFLDIRMPGASGIAVAEQIVHRPYIIFTTAFDRYAVTAFEIGALDYLLKPFGRDRVRAVLERARNGMEHGMQPIAARASQVLSESKPLTRVFVNERGLRSVRRLRRHLLRRAASPAARAPSRSVWPDRSDAVHPHPPLTHY